MNTRRMMRCMTAVLAITPLVALANIYTWNGPSGDFDDYLNWTASSTCFIPSTCYPQTCNDDATMAIDPSAVVTLSTQTMDDLTLIPGNGGELPTSLDGGGGPAQTLTCDTLTIDMSAGGSLLLTGNAIVKTAACP